MPNLKREADNVVFLGDAGQPGRSSSPSVNYDHGIRKLIAACRKYSVDAFPGSLHNLFDALDDDLYKLAENSTSNASQTVYFDAMRSIRRARSGISKAFIETLFANYDEFWRTGSKNTLIAPPQEEKVDELSLVENEDLEEDLAIHSIIGKANNRFHEELYALNKRFADLLGGAELEKELNPLSPFVVTNAFRQEMAVWDGEILIRIVIYKLFDKHLVAELDSLYAELNHILATAGILPGIRHTHKARRSVSPVSAPATEQSIDTQSAPDSSVASTAATPQAPGMQVPSMVELWGYMQDLMTTQRNELSLFAASAAASHLPVLPKDNVVDELSTLQQQTLAAPMADFQDIEQAQEQLRQALVAKLGNEKDSHNTHRLGAVDQQTIDVILLLFNQILDDQNLPDAMRAILARLQIPVLKAAVADPAFIQNDNHPARLLVNNLAKACVGWQDDGNRAEDSLYGRVKSAVDRILYEFKDDIALFDTVNSEFAEYMTVLAKKAGLVERRVTQSLQGEDRMQVSRRKVDELLQAYHPERLPKVVQRLLDDPWKKLLTITLLREGDESLQWQEAVAVADELVRSVTPGAAGASKTELLRMIPRLNEKLRAGFAFISFSSAETKKLLAELQACHITMVRAKNSPDAEQPAPASAEPQQPAESAQPKQEVEQDRFDKKVADIKEGQWVKMDIDGRKVVAKLVWSSKYTGTMLFVDGQGKKVAQIKATELAALFRNKKSRLLENPDMPIIDRALSKVMKLLQARVVLPTLEI